ncbi:SymE family type I addiction module toxin [Klebsiella oxytoca]
MPFVIAPEPTPEGKLAEAGFSTDTPVTVSVEQGRLVTEPVKG